MSEVSLYRPSRKLPGCAGGPAWHGVEHFAIRNRHWHTVETGKDRRRIGNDVHTGPLTQDDASNCRVQTGNIAR
jgi:hypothetical protein